MQLMMIMDITCDENIIRKYQWLRVSIKEWMTDFEHLMAFASFRYI